MFRLRAVPKGENKDTWTDWVYEKRELQIKQTPRDNIAHDLQILVGQGSGEIMMGDFFTKTFSLPDCH